MNNFFGHVCFGMRFIFLLGFFCMIAPTCMGASPRVVVSLAPLKSLVDDLMTGIGTSTLLVQEENSGHDFRLRPSHLRYLEKADLVVWIGPDMEGFLVPFARHSPHKMFTITQIEGIEPLPQRHVCHHHDTSRPHFHHDAVDPHVWLSINNMKHFVKALSLSLQERDAAHHHQYKKNEEELLQKLSNLQEDITKTLSPHKEKPFFVFHDSYQYFENEYGLGPSHHLVLDPEQGLSLKRLRELKEQTEESPGACLIADASIGKGRIEKMATTLGLKATLVDPLGFGRRSKSPRSYEQTLMALAKNFQACLSPSAPQLP